MKFNWDTFLKVFERAAGIPLPEIGVNINNIDDLKDSLQYFAAVPSPKVAKNILDSVFAECDVQSMTRLDQKYQGWLTDLKNDPETAKQVVAVCDYLAAHDIQTSATFYNTHVLWGANLGHCFDEHNLANSGRLLDYTHKALEQGQPQAATKCMYQFYHFGEQNNYSTFMQEELQDLYAQSMIAFIDADQPRAQSWLEDERGVGGPQSSYELAYYKAMTHLAQKSRASIRPAA